MLTFYIPDNTMAVAKGSQKSPRCGPVCQGQCQMRSEKCSGPVLMSPSFRLDRTISLPCDFISMNKITTLILNIFSVDSKLLLEEDRALAILQYTCISSTDCGLVSGAYRSWPSESRIAELFRCSCLRRISLS